VGAFQLCKLKGIPFMEAARELGCDDDPVHFDEVLKKVARHKPVDDKAVPPKPEKPCKPK